MPMFHRYGRILPLFFVLLAALPLLARGQVDSGNEIPEVTRTYALINARVVQAPGRVLERTTVIVRDGLITAVGTDVTVPFDAERIEADSLTIYAGFIDALSHAGIPAPKEQPRPERPDNPGFPPDAEAGILPGRDVRSLLEADHKSIKDLRQTGFTAAHVVPRGRMLPGMGAIILLSDGSVNEMVYTGETSLFAQLASARRMYPGTDMAVIAKMRQLFRESERRSRLEKLYADNPAGMLRPQYDPTHYALFPVLEADRPVFFHTEDALDIHRVLSLHQELGFSLVLTGANQSFAVTEKLAAAGIPVMLTLDLPEDKRDKKKDKEGEDDEAEADTTAAAPATDTAGELPEVTEKPAHDPNLRVKDSTDLEAEKKNLEARRDAQRQRYLTNAGMLAKNGLTLGFTTLDTKAADALPNIRTMVENGLSQDDALAALTTNPAQVLGVSAAMGTVEAGKLGNMVVADGNIFDKESKIRYVFVDGRKYEVEVKKEGASDSTAAAAVAGTWTYTVKTPEGEISGTLTIDEDLSGTISMDVMPEALDIENASFEDGVLTFSFDVGGTEIVTVTVTVEGDEFEGEATTSDGPVPLSGSREPETNL